MDSSLISVFQGIGAAQDAARMQRIVSFYEKLPRGPAPDVPAKGLFGRYSARYFGKNPSGARKFWTRYVSESLFDPRLTRYPTAIVHAIGFLLLLGYGQNYYFHLRMGPILV